MFMVLIAIDFFFVMHYAHGIKTDPSRSIVGDLREKH